jgi:hypothetical protein
VKQVILELFACDEFEKEDAGIAGENGLMQ